jgi:hypothetical protein
VRDREMPTIQSALTAVRAELGEPGVGAQRPIVRAETPRRYPNGPF